LFREQSFAGWLLTLLQLARPIAIANFLLQSVSFKRKRKLKMAADQRICVSVLEGAFVNLHEVGTPLPVCMHLKD